MEPVPAGTVNVQDSKKAPKAAGFQRFTMKKQCV